MVIDASVKTEVLDKVRNKGMSISEVADSRSQRHITDP